MAEKKNSKNAYVCNKLHTTVTIHRDEGTTPMFISCPVCNDRATSRMGQVDDSLEPTYEWHKPTEEECIADAKEFSKDNGFEETEMINGFLEHLKMGGLFMRKINK